jgi:cytochrome c556
MECGRTIVKKLTMLIGALTVLAAPLFAADDPVAARQALMRSNGAAAAVSAGMMRGEMDYNPTVGRAAIAAFAAVAATYGDFFPQDSAGAANTFASPKIWEDMAGFVAMLGKFQAAAAAAAEASGRDGPPDAAAFTAAVQPVVAVCRECHEAFRIER